MTKEIRRGREKGSLISHKKGNYLGIASRRAGVGQGVEDW